MRVPLLLASLVLAVAVSAQAADATTYCVHQPTDTCPALFPGQTTTDEGSNLQAALHAADGTAASTVLIGPGTYAPTTLSGFDSSGGANVVIQGAGVGRTVLSAGSADVSTVIELEGTSGSQISDLTIDVTPSVLDEGLRLEGLTQEATSGPVGQHLAVVADGTDTMTPRAVELEDGGSLLSSTVNASIADRNPAVDNSEGPATLSDDTITGYQGLSGQHFTGARLRIAAQSSAVLAGAPSSGHPTSEINGLLATVAFADSAGLIDTDAKLTVRSATFATTSATSIAAAWASATDGAGETSQLTVADSIERGFGSGESVVCLAVAGKGVPSMTVEFDDVALTGSETCPDNGTFLAGSGNINADPRFVNAAAGDYHLLYNSPAIDAGEPMCNAPCQGSDLDGLTRPIDGGSGQAIRDMGAYEYGHRPPAVTATGSAPFALPGAPVTFSAVGSDPDEDALSYQWSFDDGAVASGAQVAHAFVAPGPHTATVTVTDPTGLTGTATVAVDVVVPPLALPPAATLTVSKVSLSHTTFAVSSSPTATSASARKKHTPPPRGTSIRFTLSERATVVITITHTDAGVKVGHTCEKPSAKHRHGARCDLTVGTITRRSEPARSDAIAFSGRLGHTALAHGHYTLVLVATDAARNHSKATTKTFTIV